jgi:CubicO group peptidase (beta-lactamase class C family)
MSRLTTPAVDDALERAVELGEQRLQVAAYVGDELIVDTWIGPTTRETVFPVFSVSKGVTALAVHVQAERGLLELDAPIARYWPEYGRNGKAEVTIAHVLAHRAGVPQMPADVSPDNLGDWDWITSRLADLEPLFPPGTTNAYHAMSFGWLLGEVVRRTDPLGRSFAQFVHDELCAPLGADAFWFGIPAEVESRVAQLSFPEPPPVPPADALVNRSVPPQVALAPKVFNLSEVHAAVVPAVGGIGDARSIARLFSVFANRGTVGSTQFLSPDRVDRILERRPDFDGDDLTYGRHMPVGMGGLWVAAPGVSEGEHVIAHPGVGGTVAWAELDTGLSVSICHDRMFATFTEHPFAALVEAIHAMAPSPATAAIQ